jgi:6-phosphofructo-2-kinase/fructose-2,6-biphosphatase 2
MAEKIEQFSNIHESQHKPQLLKASPGDFMRPAARTRASHSPQANGIGVQVEDTKICVVMVGLPARGKSLIAQKGRWHTTNAK